MNYIALIFCIGGSLISTVGYGEQVFRLTGHIWVLPGGILLWGSIIVTIIVLLFCSWRRTRYSQCMEYRWLIEATNRLSCIDSYSIGHNMLEKYLLNILPWFSWRRRLGELTSGFGRFYLDKWGHTIDGITIYFIEVILV